MEKEQTFKQWCIVELFGHSKIAGLCSEQNIAGTNMLRVDVPETKEQPAFTKIYGSAAIYAINPVDEQTARMAAQGIEVAPIKAWQSESFINKMNVLNENQMLPAPDGVQEDDEDEDEVPEFYKFKPV